MAGLLDTIKEKAKQVYSQGLLSQLTNNPVSVGTELSQLFDPNYMLNIQPMSQEAALDVALSAPILGTIKNVGKTTFENAFDLAQKNAALPVSKGGLGLPATNTAIDRAKAMGFDVNTPVYHGTNADIKAMNVQGKGKTAGGGAFVTDNPIVPETYISASGDGNILPLYIKKDNLLDVNARGRNWADIWTDQLSAKSGKKKYSLDDLGLDKYSATTTDEIAQIAPELGLKGANIKNVKDLGPNSHIFRAKEYLYNKYGIVPDETWSNVTGNQFVEARNAMDKFYKSQKSNITSLQDPSMIRSKFAAFDPFRRNESDILAGVAAAPIGLLNVDTEKKKKK